MKVSVDMKMCQLHGHCVHAAEEVFAFDDAGDLVYVSEPPDELLESVDDAAELCPVQAIFVSQ